MPRLLLTITRTFAHDLHRGDGCIDKSQQAAKRDKKIGVGNRHRLILVIFFKIPGENNHYYEADKAPFLKDARDFIDKNNPAIRAGLNAFNKGLIKNLGKSLNRALLHHLQEDVIDHILT